MFELQYLFGDERDFVRVRTNIRGNPVYLYHGNVVRDDVLTTFHETVRAANELRERPRFYNLLSANCTTSLRVQTAPERRTAFDIRMLANARLDELVYERDGFVTGGLSFPDLRARALINDDAKAAHDDPDFSARIRRGRPGFSELE